MVAEEVTKKIRGLTILFSFYWGGLRLLNHRGRAINRETFGNFSVHDSNQNKRLPLLEFIQNMLFDKSSLDY